MKCSLKDGLINLLLIIFITPSKGIEFPLFLRRSSVLGKPMNMQQFRATINRLQDLDSFPGDGENQLHRIVKKQMGISEYKETGKRKRSIIDLLKPKSFASGAGDGPDSKDGAKTEKSVDNSDLMKPKILHDTTDTDSFLRKLKAFAREKDEAFFQRTKKNDTPSKLEEDKISEKEKDKIKQVETMDKEMKELQKHLEQREMKKENDLEGGTGNEEEQPKGNLEKALQEMNVEKALQEMKKENEQKESNKKDVTDNSNIEKRLKEIEKDREAQDKNIEKMLEDAKKQQEQQNEEVQKALEATNDEKGEENTEKEKTTQDPTNEKDLKNADIEKVLEERKKEKEEQDENIEKTLKEAEKEKEEQNATVEKALEEMKKGTEVKDEKEVKDAKEPTKVKEEKEGKGKKEEKHLKDTKGEKHVKGVKLAQKHAKEVKHLKETKEEKQVEETKEGEDNSCLCKQCRRFPDTTDYRYYYECEANANGCMKLKHKRCPKGEFFSFKYLKCLKPPTPKKTRQKKSTRYSKKFDLPDVNPEDSEPANEWLDASQGVEPKIPSEFKPRKKPWLKIYHLRMKRKMDDLLRNEIIENHRLCGRVGSPRVDAHRKTEVSVHGIVKKHGIKHHIPKSFVIHINKKEGKDDQITENDENENDSDEDDEENEEEEGEEDDEADEGDEDEEADDEDDESEEDEGKKTTQEKFSCRESLKDFIKSAKAAVTNRARFEDPTEIAAKSVSSQRGTSSLKSKKSNDYTNGNKQVLIDANIKVDTKLSSVLRSFLKSKGKEKDGNNGFANDFETFVGDKGGQNQLTGTYENLMRNNPRVKRYFLANCAERGN